MGLDWSQIIIAFITIIPATGAIIASLATKKKSDIYKDRADRAEQEAEELRNKMKEGSKLIYHPLFRRLDEYERDITVNLDKKFTEVNLGKRLIFTEILKMKLRIWKHHLYKLAEKLDTCMAECEDMCGMLEVYNFDTFEDAMKAFDEFPMNPDYSHEDRVSLLKTIPLFNIWHESRVKFMQERIKDVCNQDLIYVDCRQKMVAIFDSYVHAFGITLSDYENSISQINGSLHGLVFKNVVIGKEH